MVNDTNYNKTELNPSIENILFESFLNIESYKLESYQSRICFDNCEKKFLNLLNDNQKKLYLELCDLESTYFANHELELIKYIFACFRNIFK